MYCNICGCENGVRYHVKKGSQFLCDYCSWETPRKVNRESFCQAFFNTTTDKVARGILEEFYDDYRTSIYTLKHYCEKCSRDIDE